MLAVSKYRLTILSGASGVGKSSLLNAGMAPDLRSAGFKVVVCREWFDGRGDGSGRGFLATKVAEAIRGQDELSPAHRLAADELYFVKLNRLFGAELVIIFDQFEELLRYAPSQAAASIAELLAINKQLDLRIVVSLRSEHLHELAPLEKNVLAFSLFPLTLEPVTDPDAIRRIIEAPNKRAEDGDQKIAPAAVTDLVRSWEAMLASEHDDALAIGLLHLQALLYTLWSMRTDGEGPITRKILNRFRPAGESWAVYPAGLAASIDVKLDRCRRAAEVIGLDRYLVVGARRSLAQMVGHLSSAGFKIARELDDLFANALHAELAVLLPAIELAGRGPGVDGSTVGSPDGTLEGGQLHDLIKVLVDSAMPTTKSPLDLFGATRLQICRSADKRHDSSGAKGWADRLHHGADPWVANLLGASCGPLMGMAPANVLIEEVRRFAFAIAWLRESQLVRITSPGSVGPRVTLVHDGFGRSLETWAKEPLASTEAALTALTAPSGAVFTWRTDPHPKRRAHAIHAFLPEFDGRITPMVSTPDGGTRSDPSVVIPNLRWRGAWVEADFRQTVFVNCDFRGSFFSGCTFEGVTFMNCLLDGAIFSDCDIVGGSFGADDEPWVLDEPTFLVELADPSVSADMARLRGCADKGRLFSPKPGLPCVPTWTSRDARTIDAWKPETKGLTIYGGRISSLVFRNCTSGRIALRHVAGSGLEIVEQEQGMVEITGAVLRHLTITTAVGTERGTFTIRVHGSALGQVWLGDNLTGTMRVRDSQLAQIFNPSRLVATVDPPVGEERPSKSFQLVGFADDAGAPIVEGSGPDSTEEFATSQGRQMDYRRDPAYSEAREAFLAKRARAASRARGKA